MQPTNTRIPARWGVLLSLVLVAPLGAQQASPQKAAQARRQKNPSLRPVIDNPKLPRVLLIGDSISIGYTLPVRKQLQGTANVHRPPTNCGPTTRGLSQIEQWIGKQPWDVIHFNWGLHDLKYLGPNGENLADPQSESSRQQVPIAAYERNLRKLVARLLKTKATLIWCPTTPVPSGAKGRVVGDAARYNAVALKVMRAHQIAVNDLYAFSKPRLQTIQRRANVHFTPDGSQALAGQVVDSIRRALARRSPAKSPKSSATRAP